MQKQKALYWLLRLATVGIFLGHGWFGVMGGKAAWLPYFHVLHIPDTWAWPMMRAVGILDVSVAIVILFRPVRPALYYAVFWGFWTALLRPLAGQGWWEFLERIPNWIVPLAFLHLHFSRPFYRNTGRDLSGRVRLVVQCLLFGTAVHLIGHGGYGAIMGKQVWHSYLAAYGFTLANADVPGLVQVFGWFEMALGAVILFWPARALVLLACVCLVFDPGARPLVDEPIWEFIERFGNISVSFALLTVFGRPRTFADWFSPRSRKQAVAMSDAPPAPWYAPAPSDIGGAR